MFGGKHFGVERGLFEDMLFLPHRVHPDDIVTLVLFSRIGWKSTYINPTSFSRGGNENGIYIISWWLWLWLVDIAPTFFMQW